MISADKITKLYGETNLLANVACEYVVDIELNSSNRSSIEKSNNNVAPQVDSSFQWSNLSSGSIYTINKNNQSKKKIKVTWKGQLLMTDYRLNFIPDINHFFHEFESNSWMIYHIIPNLTSQQKELVSSPAKTTPNIPKIADSSKVDKNINVVSILEYFEIPLGCISTLEKKSDAICLSTKDIRTFKFSVDSSIVREVYKLMAAYVFPQDISLLFAFRHKLPSTCELSSECTFKQEHWEVYSPFEEWRRQGVMEDPQWRITDMNTDFSEIETYPSFFAIPSSISDTVLKGSCLFRALGRIPILSWLDSSSGAALCRSGQPKIGVSNATSTEDEQLVSAIANANYLRKHIHIIDCRPKTNAMANKAKGYGVESTSNYINSTIHFMNITNIHSIRESYEKLCILVQSKSESNITWLGSIESTKWLYHIRLLLEAAFIASEIIRQKGESVLIHCSHGWDRTSQVSSLAQLFLDPYYRTIKGFKVLIEKEWLACGHPFQMRQSHGEKADSDISPIFLQFMDSVWQLVNQFPSYFEFNELLLLILVDHVHSCRFGNFLVNTSKECKENQLNTKTTSVWGLLDLLSNELIEKSYIKNQYFRPCLSFIHRNVCLWGNQYLRWSLHNSLHLYDTSDLERWNEELNVNIRLPHYLLRVLQQIKTGRAFQKIHALESKVKDLENEIMKLKDWFR